MMRPSTQLLAYGAGALVLVLCVLLGVQTVRLAGAGEALATEKAAHLKTKRDEAEKLRKAMGDARETESGLRKGIEALQDAARLESENAKAREDALVESVRAGNRRLSVAARCPAGPATVGDPASAGRGERPPETRAELDPAASERILTVGRDGDRNTRERNLCVEAYEEVRGRLNALNKRFSDAAR